MLQIGSIASSHPSAAAASANARSAPARIAARPLGIEVALVDQHLGAARDRGDDAGREVGAAGGADAAVLAGHALERDDRARGRHAGVGAAVHGRGPGVAGRGR